MPVHARHPTLEGQDGAASGTEPSLDPRDDRWREPDSIAWADHACPLRRWASASARVLNRPPIGVWCGPRTMNHPPRMRLKMTRIMISLSIVPTPIGVGGLDSGCKLQHDRLTHEAGSVALRFAFGLQPNNNPDRVKKPEIGFVPVDNSPTLKLHR